MPGFCVAGNTNALFFLAFHPCKCYESHAVSTLGFLNSYSYFCSHHILGYFNFIYVDHHHDFSEANGKKIFFKEMLNYAVRKKYHKSGGRNRCADSRSRGLKATCTGCCECRSKGASHEDGTHTSSGAPVSQALLGDNCFSQCPVVPTMT